METFDPDDVVYFQYFDPANDLGGLGPLESSLGEVGLGRDVIRHAQSFFVNGARLDGILSLPGAQQGDIDAAETRWKRVFRGVRNAFKVLVVGGGERGVAYTPVTAPPKDLAMVELSSEVRRAICAAFGVPPVLVGVWEASNYSTHEWRRSFYTETIMPELDFLEDEINNQFVSRFWPNVRIKFDVSDIEALREDELKRNQALSIAVGGRWMTPNEARERAGLPPLPGGDVLQAEPLGGFMPAAPEVAAKSDPFATREYARTHECKAEPFHPEYRETGAQGALERREGALLTALLDWWRAALRDLDVTAAKKNLGDVTAILGSDEWWTIRRDELSAVLAEHLARSARDGGRMAGRQLGLRLSWD